MLSHEGTFVNVLQIFLLNLLAAVALVNLCYFIARFVGQGWVIYVGLLCFFVFPILAGNVPDTKK